MSNPSRRGTAIIAILCCAILFVGINFIADRALPGSRIDLTQGRLYTLADGTKKTLGELTEPITLRFYYSKRLGDEVPAYGLYAQRVREMLEEYQARSGGKLKLEITDPLPYSPAEDRAVEHVSEPGRAFPADCGQSEHGVCLLLRSHWTAGPGA